MLCVNASIPVAAVIKEEAPWSIVDRQKQFLQEAWVRKEFSFDAFHHQQ
jgi:hypothetical protein